MKSKIYSLQWKRYKSYQSSAKQRKLDFNLDFDDFRRYWQNDCHYCGGTVETIGLDRIDSDDGYNLDNIVPCCTKCNKMKLDTELDEFIDRCRRITARSFNLPVDSFNK